MMRQRVLVLWVALLSSQVLAAGDIDLLREAANGGIPEAQYELAQKLERGDGVTKSASEARKWYEKAAKAGHGPAKAWVAKAVEQDKQAQAKKDASQKAQAAEAAVSQQIGKMVVIPAGSFVMGSDEGEDDEKPPHQVRIPSFKLGQNEVTRGQYARFIQATGYATEGGCYYWDGDSWERDGSRNWQSPGYSQRDNHPAVCISFNDAQTYIRWLNQVYPGKGFRLPSEAEWEYAARAGNARRYPWGDTPGTGRANCKESLCQDGSQFTSAVGSFAANAFGLRDMIGNVVEWTQDCYVDSYQSTPRDGMPNETGECKYRVLRGGSWYTYNPAYLRSSYRLTNSPGSRYTSYGFRLAQDL